MLIQCTIQQINQLILYLRVNDCLFLEQQCENIVAQ